MGGDVHVHRRWKVAQGILKIVLDAGVAVFHEHSEDGHKLPAEADSDIQAEGGTRFLKTFKINLGQEHRRADRGVGGQTQQRDRINQAG